MSGHSEQSSDLSFDVIAVPLASEEDIDRTVRALRPHLPIVTDIVLVHVIEKAGGGIDPAPVEQRRVLGEEILDRCEREISSDVGAVTSEITYHTDVVDGILEAAREGNADSIVFTPREGGRFSKLVSGDDAFDLIHQTELPVLVLPVSNSHE